MKEKRQVEEFKDKTIYYEVLGIILIILSIIILLMLGNVGKYLNIILRIIVGDYYTVFLIFVFLYGIKLLFNLDYNLLSLRMNGLYLLFCTLSLLGHKDIYHYSLSIDNNSIQGLFSLYKIYISNFDTSYVFGGGIILGTLYQLIYFLFGVSTSFILMILLFVSLIFLSNNTIKSFFIKIKGIKKIKFNRITNYIKSLHIEKKVDKSILSNFIEEDRVLEDEMIKKLKEVFFKLNIEFKIRNHYVSYSYTLFLIDASYDIDILKVKIEERLNKNINIYYDDYLIIEVPNSKRYLLTLKNLMDENSYIGFSNKKIVLDFKKYENILVNGFFETGIKTFIKSIITQIYINHDYDIMIYDETSKNDFLGLNVIREDYYSFLKKLKNLIDERYEESIKKRLIVIINEKGIEDLDYILRSSNNALVNIIVINRNISIDKKNINLFKTKIVFKSNSLLSKELLENRRAINLEKKGDFYLRFENSIIRCQSPFISEGDFKKLIRRI